MNFCLNNNTNKLLSILKTTLKIYETTKKDVSRIQRSTNIFFYFAILLKDYYCDFFCLKIYNTMTPATISTTTLDKIMIGNAFTSGTFVS